MELTQWSVWDVCRFLEALGFEAYCKRFKHQMVDGQTLLGLTDAQLKVRQPACCKSLYQPASMVCCSMTLHVLWCHWNSGKACAAHAAWRTTGHIFPGMSACSESLP